MAPSVVPLVLAFVSCGALLALIGRDPGAFLEDTLNAGLYRPLGLQDSIMRSAPILVIGAGLILVFRAGLWNLGADGQYLLAAAVVGGVAPSLLASTPGLLGWSALALLAFLVGASWTLLPAWLKARYGVSEIITTLMMSFIGVGLANLLVKGPFDGPSPEPQTGTIAATDMLWDLPGTRVHVGVVVAIGLAVLVHLLITRFPFGTRLGVLGANPRAAVHLGIDVPRVTVIAFLLSGGLIGLAAFTDIVGVFGYMRSDWNPAYGLKVVPLVFLARLNVLAMIPLSALFGVLSVGGDYATRRADLPSDFLLIFMALIFLFMIVAQYLVGRRERGLAVVRSRPTKAGASDS